MKKKALLVGVNYKGTKAELKGCREDVLSVKKLLESYQFSEIRVLVEDSDSLPTRDNILNGMKWLVQDAKSGDSLFFQFSGHGGQEKDKSGDEADGVDETICPLDFETKGQIIDDDIHLTVATPLPEGVRLTALFDACHSGTGMDLPYCYLPNGQVKHSINVKQMASDAMGIRSSFLKGDKLGAAKQLFNMVQPKQKREKTTKAQVILFSGCKDAQTSADAHIEQKFQGAMTWALLTALKEKPSQTYAELLGNCRKLLSKYSQTPQMSSGKEFDMNQMFSL